MAHAYTPGLKVSSRMRHRARRLLPIPGEVLVGQGDRVQSTATIAQTFMPGDVTPVNLSKRLSLAPAEVLDCMLKHEGDWVEAGEVIARTKGIFGFFKTEFRVPVSGTIESISSVTGQMILRGKPNPVQVRAFLSGTVLEVIPEQGVVIEAETTYIQGIFGIGGEAFGPIHMACADCTEELTADLITPKMAGGIVIGGARMTGEAVRKGIEVGVAAMISGGMDDQDLKEILGYDLGVAVTGSEQIGIVLVITEGFGEIAMAERTFRLFASRAGDEAAVCGATQIRAGVMRPEIVIPLPDDQPEGDVEPAMVAGVLERGAQVRVIRDPHFGLIGTVSDLPSELTPLESGSKARVLEVKFSSGESVVVPRANVELIET